MIEIVGVPLTQWDVNRKVEVTGEAEYVHFANAGDSKAVKLPLVNGQCEIPEHLLQTEKALNVYAVLDGVTLESKSFAVRKRERPEDYIYKPDQREYIYTLIDEANKAIEKADDAAQALRTVVPEGSGFYDSISDALSHKNASSTGNVKVVGSTITLMADIEETNPITFSSDTDLILDGHKMTMRDGGDKITVGSGVTVSIDGTKDGSAIIVDANAKAAVLMRAHGTLRVDRGRYSVTNGANVCAAFTATPTCPAMMLNGCTVSVDAGSSGSAISVQSQAKKLEFCDGKLTLNGGVTTAAQYENAAVISNATIVGTAVTQSNGIVCFSDSNTNIDNLDISAESQTGNAVGLQLKTNATVSAENLRISAVTNAEPESNVSAFGVYNDGTCTIANSSVLADSKYGHSDGACSVGIHNSSTGTMTCRNAQSVATLAGLQNYGNMFVSRCLLSGVSHGGLYTLHDSKKDVVVNDTVLEAGVYRGQFADIYAALFDNTTSTGNINALASMYFGDINTTNDGGNLYMDSCIFVGLCNEAFVVRAAAYTANGLAIGKHPNQLFISRSKITAQQTDAEKGQIPSIRLNRGDDGVLQYEFANLSIGTGCNFTVDNVQLSQDVAKYVYSNDALYRQKDQHLPTYEEYYALMKEE